jgi:hypothetical protein
MPASSLETLLAHKDWFSDPARDDASGAVPPILVLDDFYDDPDEVRRLALAKPYVQYIPPDPEIVGAETADRNAGRQGRWLSSAFVTYHGRPAENPFHGERFNPPWLREKLEQCVGETIIRESWETGGDHWNGAFHLVEGGFGVGEGIIHHHFKKGDLEGRGWSGVVYLSPDAPASSGTSFWRNRSTGRCVAPFGAPFHSDPDEFECVLRVENRFNRAVLLRENVWHRVEHGFGEGNAARLTQTFFFAVES